MATRSRRSTGGADALNPAMIHFYDAGGADALNPAMIHFYDAGRLRRELQQRGLDTTGNKTVLADRLQEAVLLERNPRQAAYSPPPQPEKPVRRGAKRTSKAEAVLLERNPRQAAYSPPPQPEKPVRRGTKRTSKANEENEPAATSHAEEISSPKAKKPCVTEEAVGEMDLIEESFSIELLNMASVDEMQREAEKTMLEVCATPDTSMEQGPAVVPDVVEPAITSKLPEPSEEAVPPRKIGIVEPEQRVQKIKILIRRSKSVSGIY
ncbi:unnamed protein product [Gongylonema pulchrum]|uniref:SAP domain-containing protein n=1 Tax=Gongylonema pulchrum TaxID=637853 RepID=A0A183DUS6_9BILA|nr:unnamed protein product [Gongylonema pulchrum]